MSKYIKSHSNYVIKTRHQNTNDGVIYERDITTIGGRDQFAPGQVPIYKSGNFVITINNDINDYKKVSDRTWERNEDGEVWTLDNLRFYEKDEKTSDETKIIIKKDYYDLRDYAYYGSCAELMRTSISDILKNYPGELFIPVETLYSGRTGVQYTEAAAIAAFGRNTSSKTNYKTIPTGLKDYYTAFDTESARTLVDDCGVTINYTPTPLLDPLTDEEKKELENGVPYTREYKWVTIKSGNTFVYLSGNTSGETVTTRTKTPMNLILVDNPFNINMHDNFIPDGADPLKYFTNGGVENYEAYVKNSDETEWVFDDKHSWFVEVKDVLYDGVSDITSNSESIFNVQTGIIDECTTNIDVNVEAYEETIYSSDCAIECICPGKYIGRIFLDFTQKEYSFKTIPGEKSGEKLSFANKSEIEGDPIRGKYNGEDTKIDSTYYDVDDMTVEIYMFYGQNGEIKYFINGDDEKNYRWRIRPIKDVIEGYFDGLDSFEKLLLNRDSSPIYTSTFELIDESDYGNYTYLKQFTFPTTYGGYNLGSSTQNFEKYVQELSEIGEFYDSKYTDNLWRSMTHEAIKNFDWTYTRHYESGEEVPYVEGGTKIQKLIRIYGREFDEIKTYIDAINDSNTVTYDDVNNLPDYFFTDKLEDEGWDVKLIQPIKLCEYINDDLLVPVDIGTLFNGKMYNDNGNAITMEQAEQLNYFYDSSDTNTRNKITIQRVFNQENVEIRPYSFEKIFGTDDGKKYSNPCGEIIKIYDSESVYKSQDINCEFFKRLLLNSQEIWRHKGTIEGIEMLLGLFGLRSKNKIFNDEKYFKTKYSGDAYIGNTLPLTSVGKEYYTNYHSQGAGGTNKFEELYDYDIKEYTLFTTNIEDAWLPDKNMYMYDWVNSTKLITYDTESYNNGEYISYQGLPVSYQESAVTEGNETVKKRLLYPHFNSNGIYDGNPYYQMNGGWMRKKPFMFDSKNNIVTENGNDLFTETVRNIKTVKTLQELLADHSLADFSGDICEVSDLSGRYAVIDGTLYPLFTEYSSNETTSGYSFFYATISNHSLSVGNAFFTDTVTISNPYAAGNKEKINLTEDYYNDREIKIYVLKDNNGYSVDVYSKDNSISTFTVFENGKYMEGDNYTHYFRLNNVDYYNELSVLGWQQLKSDEYEYYKLSTITDYRDGNNPHNGKMQYDNGYEYLTYFQRLFKTAYDEDLFDYRQYTDSDIDYISSAASFGFSGLIDSDYCNKDYDEYLMEDTKCHFFGNVSGKIMTNKSRFKKRVTFETISNRDEKNYKLTDVYRKNKINDNAGVHITNLKYGSNSNDGNITDITDQIVNTKRMDIEFFIKGDYDTESKSYSKEYSKSWLEEVKYIDSVILPYLSQMIPSSVIWTVKYITIK